MHCHLFQMLESANLWAKIYAVSGELLWGVALFFMIRDSVRDKTNSMPLVAMCLNLAYEAYYAFVCPYVYPNICIDDHGAQLWTWRIWLLLNLVLFYYLLRYGRECAQEIPVVKLHFHAWIVALFILGFAGQATFVPFYNDVNGNEGTTFCNLIMSIAYIMLFYARPDMKGLSIGAAWTKMLGSGLINLSITVCEPFPNPGYASNAFMYYLFISIFLFDAIYVYLLHRRRRELATAEAASRSAARGESPASLPSKDTLPVGRGRWERRLPAGSVGFAHDWIAGKRHRWCSSGPI